MGKGMGKGKGKGMGKGKWNQVAFPLIIIII